MPSTPAIMNSEDFNRFEQIIVNFKEEVKAEFRHQIGIQSEHFQHKLDIVVEGHEVLCKEIRDTREELSEKIKFVDFKVDVLSQKIDSVAADLTAHRRDTEAQTKFLCQSLSHYGTSNAAS